MLLNAARISAIAMLLGATILSSPVTAQESSQPHAAASATVPVQVIVLRSPEDADKILARLHAGEDFASLAKSESIDPTAPNGGFIGDVDPSTLRSELRDALQGAKTFALWPLSQAAESCFGSSIWPDTFPSPHAWLEFDVESVESATAELESMGYQMLLKNKKEPWGQTVSRFLDPDGLLVGLTFTPWMREKK